MAWEVAKGILLAVSILCAVVPITLALLYICGVVGVSTIVMILEEPTCCYSPHIEVLSHAETYPVLQGFSFAVLKQAGGARRRNLCYCRVRGDSGKPLTSVSICPCLES